jgi:prephenate dehydrogenase
MMVASVSHLPHLLAGALVNTVGEVEKDYQDVFKIAAGGFRDVTRIADSQPELWKDIFLSNKEFLLKVLEIYKEQIAELEKYILSDNEDKLIEKLTRSKKLREQVPAKVKGLLPALSEIVVTIPDKPGEIGKVANILGAKDINIIDIEILRVREGDGGTLRLGFIHEEERTKAIEVLTFFGYATKTI